MGGIQKGILRVCTAKSLHKGRSQDKNQNQQSQRPWEDFSSFPRGDGAEKPSWGAEPACL